MASSDAISFFGSETLKLCEFNARFKQLLGISDDAQLPQTLPEIVDAPMETLQANVQRILAEGHMRIEERCYRLPDGSIIEVDLAGSLIYLDNTYNCRSYFGNYC